MAPSLIGPPPTTTPTTQPFTSTTNDPFMDLLLTKFNKPNFNHPLRDSIGYTEGNSATHLSSGNPCLDLFFHVVPKTTTSSSIDERLTRAWDHDPLTTLKLICNLRSVRGPGKSDKEGFYNAIIWLHKNHPKTLACNLDSFALFGYFKDFPEILYRILGLSHPPKMRKNNRYYSVQPKLFKRFKGKKNKGLKARSIQSSFVLQEKQKLMALEAATIRHNKKSNMAKTAIERYNRDPDYRFLLDRVSELFADYLRSDLEALNASEFNKISLAAKWAPSLDSCYDRATLLCEAIARKMFPREKHEEYSGVEEAHYAYRVRDRLRKEVLVPLRRKLELPEVFMSAKKWDELPYNRVASIAMNSYKHVFKKHDEERFQAYLEKVKAGKAKIAAGALLPLQIIESLMNDVDGGGKVTELQWATMVKGLSKKGKLKNCLAVCDVCSSLDGSPMEACIALGLLLSELSDEPWKGKVITFSERPQLHIIQGPDLRSKTEFIREMKTGGKANFQKVFELILSVAKQGKLAKERMIKKVFVLSDMEFEKASEVPWETDYKAIKRKFEEDGYGGYVPEIVFWNLRDSRSTPVSEDQEGVALVSGFSKNIMEVFLDGKEDHKLTPQGVMEAAIDREECSKLVVLD